MRGSETLSSSSGLLQRDISRDRSKDFQQDTCWERRQGLNPHPRALRSARALPLAVNPAVITCPEPPPADKPVPAPTLGSFQTDIGAVTDIFAGMRAGVMDPSAGHGSGSKHQPCWAAAELEVFKRREILAWKKSFDLGGWLVFLSCLCRVSPDAAACNPGLGGMSLRGSPGRVML